MVAFQEFSASFGDDCHHLSNRLPKVKIPTQANIGLAWGPPLIRYGYCLLPDSSFASLTLAASSFCWTLAKASLSCSAGTVLFHSWTARSQWAAASFRRPVFW